MDNPSRKDAAHDFDREIAIGPIAAAVVGLVVTVVVSMLLMGLLLSDQQRRAVQADPAAPAMTEARERARPPAPRLQDSPPVDLELFRAQERFLLENYGWVDRPAGIARIPIARAMEILAASALPVREEPPAVTAPHAPTATAAPAASGPAPVEEPTVP